MKNDWVRALGKLTYGIYVLTTSHEDTINGMIASWVSQVSYEPPLIVVAVHPNRFSHALIEKSDRFALHVLAKEQKPLVSTFMRFDPETKFSGVAWQSGKIGCPILTECVAFFECKLHSSLQPGNHTLFIGEVVHADVVSDATLLTTQDYKGQYIGKM